MTVKEEAAKFPKTFGLRAFPGDRFTINESASYMSAGRVMLYIFTEDGKAFSKGTPEEIEREVTPAPAAKGERTRGITHEEASK
jgi:hypothetical protein